VATVSVELDGARQVVSTRMPVSATMRSTIVVKIAIAARPNPDGLPAGSEVAEEAESADTVTSRVEVAVELARNPEPLPGPESVFHR
jgi:hypothetical protein